MARKSKQTTRTTKAKRATKVKSSVAARANAATDLLDLEDCLNEIRGQAMVIRLAVVGLISDMSGEAVGGLHSLISLHVGELRRVAAEIGRVRAQRVDGRRGCAP